MCSCILKWRNITLFAINFLSQKVPDILSARYYLKWGFFFSTCFSKLYFIHCSTCREKLFLITEDIHDNFFEHFLCSFWINLPLLTKFIVCKHVPLHFKGPPHPFSERNETIKRMFDLIHFFFLEIAKWIAGPFR